MLGTMYRGEWRVGECIAVQATRGKKSINGASEINKGRRVPTEILSIPAEPSALARPSGERRRRSGVVIPMVSQSERATAKNSNVVLGFACDLFACADCAAVVLRQRASPAWAETRNSRGSVVPPLFERHDST